MRNTDVLRLTPVDSNPSPHTGRTRWKLLENLFSWYISQQRRSPLLVASIFRKTNERNVHLETVGTDVGRAPLSPMLLHYTPSARSSFLRNVIVKTLQAPRIVQQPKEVLNIMALTLLKDVPLQQIKRWNPGWQTRKSTNL